MLPSTSATSTLQNHVRSDVAVVAAIGDPDGTRTVTSIIALLVAIGIALLLVALWMYRRTRPDPELLAPLEVMGERSWRRGDPVWQRRRLDELRPRGARPLAPSAAPPDLDEAFDAGPTARGFDDLHHADAPDHDGAPATHGGGNTPIGLGRPDDQAFGDDDFDAEALASAREELDRELARGAEPPVGRRSPDGSFGGVG